VLDKYTHSNPVYYKHNRDNKPYDITHSLLTQLEIIYTDKLSFNSKNFRRAQNNVHT